MISKMNKEQIDTIYYTIYHLLTPIQRNFILRAVEAYTNEIVEELFDEGVKPTQQDLKEIQELEKLCGTDGRPGLAGKF